MDKYGGTKNLIAAGMVLLAAVIFSVSVYVHDTRETPGAGFMPPLSAASSPSLKVLPGVANPADAIPHYSRLARQMTASGWVAEFTNDEIKVLSVPPGSGQASPPGVMPSFTLKLNADTQFFRRGARKTEGQYKKEMDQFLKDMSAATDKTVIYMAPDQFVRTQISRDVIRPGMQVIVEAINFGEPDGYAKTIAVVP